MKYKIYLITAIIVAVAFLGCNGGSGSSSEKKNFDKDTSYALGLSVGAGLVEDLIGAEIYPDYNEVLKGIKDGFRNKTPRFDVFEARERIEAAVFALTELKMETAMQDEVIFLAENARKPGITITQTGLQYEIISEGYGARPSSLDRVLVHYEGTFTNGKFFDSSYTRGVPAEFNLDDIIPGWTEGLQLMRVGGKYKFYVPSELGYGEEGMRDWSGRELIPPFATLIFEVELLEINPN